MRASAPEEGGRPSRTLADSPVELDRSRAAGGEKAIFGSCSFSAEGLGITPGNQFGLNHAFQTAELCASLSARFEGLWGGVSASREGKESLLARLDEIHRRKSPAEVCFFTIHHLFKDLGEELDEERIVESATGIRNSMVWRKLFKFRRDGVVGAIDKLEKHGGCIIADRVGLGKTFEALAIIKYYELRNDRVLVLCSTRLRDNWTLYKSIDRRNILAADRLNYDLLNFSHSALREGWDNPNVFQICALREIGAERERRQTIGRGLRLCVNQAGERLRGFEVKTLTAVATESYERFAENLKKRRSRPSAGAASAWSKSTSSRRSPSSTRTAAERPSEA